MFEMRRRPERLSRHNAIFDHGNRMFAGNLWALRRDLLAIVKMISDHLFFCQPAT